LISPLWSFPWTIASQPVVYRQGGRRLRYDRSFKLIQRPARGCSLLLTVTSFWRSGRHFWPHCHVSAGAMSPDVIETDPKQPWARQLEGDKDCESRVSASTWRALPG